MTAPAAQEHGTASALKHVAGRWLGCCPLLRSGVACPGGYEFLRLSKFFRNISPDVDAFRTRGITRQERGIPRLTRTGQRQRQRQRRTFHPERTGFVPLPPLALCLTWCTSHAEAGWLQPPGHRQCWSRRVTALRSRPGRSRRTRCPAAGSARPAGRRAGGGAGTRPARPDPTAGPRPCPRLFYCILLP